MSVASGSDVRAIPRDELDARLSPVLLRELPGLAMASDAREALVAVREALVGEPSGRSDRSTIRSCEPAEALYIPGDCCLVRYRVEGAGPDGDPVSFSVNGRIYPDPDRARAYVESRLAPLAEAMSGRPEVAGLAAPVGMMPRANATLSVFPIDGELPSLVRATDPAVAAGLVRRSVPRPDDVGQVRVELVRYRRQHGCLLRYWLRGGPGEGGTGPDVVYGKIAGGGEGAFTGPALAAIEEVILGQEEAFTVPRMFGYFPELQLVLMESIAGVPQLVRLLKARLQGTPAPATEMTLEDSIDLCARIAAMLHMSGIRVGPERDLDRELVPLDRAGRAVVPISPRLGAVFLRAIDHIGSSGGASEPMVPSFAHGDFKYTQLLFDGRRPGLVDFDTVCQAEPALDLGHFCAYLRLATSKAVKGAAPAAVAECERLRRRFLGSYSAARWGSAPDAALLERVRIYEQVSLLRLSLHAWQRFKPVRLGYLVDLLTAGPSRRPNHG